MKIVVVEASGLHLGFLGCYGNEWVATPNLDRLAADSVVFDWHIADCPELTTAGPWQQRSVMTGRYSFPGSARPTAALDGVVRHESIAELERFAPRTIELLDADGDAPILWLDGPNLAPPWRLPADLLTSYDEDEDEPEPLTDPAVGLASLDLEALDHLQTTYAAVVTFFDAQLGRILDALRVRGRLDSLLFCITARCGLPLGEHGMTGMERAWLHDELVHVPLIVRLPRAEEAGLRVDALTQPIDLMPTLRAHLGMAALEGHGCDLMPLVRGRAQQVRPYAASGLRLEASEEWSLRTPDRALLLPIGVPAGDPPRGLQLYVKPDDRWEVNDLSLRYEEEADQLQQTLRAFVDATRRPGTLAYPPLPEEVPDKPAGESSSLRGESSQ